MQHGLQTFKQTGDKRTPKAFLGRSSEHVGLHYYNLWNRQNV